LKSATRAGCGQPGRLVLTDETNNLIKWRFPNVSLAANGYLIVFASDKNRTNPPGGCTPTSNSALG
jgi:hypothetical protein